MKYVLFVFTLIAISKPSLGQSSIGDVMKDGSDLVIKYKHEDVVQFLESQSFAKYKSFAFIRKGSEPDQFIVQQRKFEFDGNNSPDQPPTSDDLKALKLPFIVGVNQKFKPDYIKATPEDTRESLLEKKILAKSMFMNTTHLIASLPRMLAKKNVFEARKLFNGMHYGNCNVLFRAEKINDELFVVTMSAKRSDCTEQVDKEILKKLKAEDLDPSSEFKTEFTYQQSTLEFYKVGTYWSAKDIADPNHTYNMVVEVELEKYEPFVDEIAESQFTMQYKVDELKRNK